MERGGCGCKSCPRFKRVQFQRRPFRFDIKSAQYDISCMRPIKKNFYLKHPDVINRSDDEVESFRASNQVTVVGSDVPEPLMNFREGNFPEYIDKCLTEKGFKEPTCIQSQGWPIILSGRDMVGIAQTGSGKTLAYVLPGLVHISHQTAQSHQKDGPTVLILAPTRELAQQIQTVCEDFGRPAGIKNVCLVGGAPFNGQLRELRKGPQIYIATPGRLIDLIQSGYAAMKNCSFVVVDEADRMLDVGFEPQIRTIFNQIRPDRQTVMFSATWPKGVEELATDFMVDYIRVQIGSLELTANRNITQIVEVVDESEKFNELCKLLTEIMSKGDKKTLVFASTKKRVNEITTRLKKKGFASSGIHGNKSQNQRNMILAGFRKGVPPILVATDVAARGLDIDNIEFVINVDFPFAPEHYIHRIGRTARADNTGTAYTFFCLQDIKQGKYLVNVLQEAHQEVNPKLLELIKSGPGKGKVVESPAAVAPPA